MNKKSNQEVIALLSSWSNIIKKLKITVINISVHIFVHLYLSLKLEFTTAFITVVITNDIAIHLSRWEQFDNFA